VGGMGCILVKLLCDEFGLLLRSIRLFNLSSLLD
jgi:hypothetical protein